MSILDLPQELPHLLSGEYGLESPSGLVYTSGTLDSLTRELREEFGPVTATNDPRLPLAGWQIVFKDRPNHIVPVCWASDCLIFSWGSLVDLAQ
jgi:hypothetical protein